MSSFILHTSVDVNDVEVMSIVHIIICVSVLKKKKNEETSKEKATNLVCFIHEKQWLTWYFCCGLNKRELKCKCNRFFLLYLN